MSSVQATIAQRPTKKFVALAAGNAFTLAQVVAAFPAGSVQVVGSVYLVNTQANYITFAAAVQALNGGAVTALIVGETLQDMGAQFSVGIQGGESKLLTFRKVKTGLGATLARGGDGWDGYVVVENNVSRDGTGALTPGDLPCCVARV